MASVSPRHNAVINYEDILSTPYTDAPICARLSVHAVTLIQFLLTLHDSREDWGDWDEYRDEIEALIADTSVEAMTASEECVTPMTIPVGSIVQFGAASLPDGWLYCNGDEVLKSSYPALWDTITNTWGTPELGSDYFVLPDFRNRSPYGYQYGGGASKNMGSYHGAETVTLTEAQMPVHDHDIWTDNEYSSGSVGSTGLIFDGAGTPIDLQTGERGGGEPHNNLHPVAVCGFIIFAGA